MQAQLTEFLLKITFQGYTSPIIVDNQHPTSIQKCSLSSSQLLSHIYETMSSDKNYKDMRSHRLSFSSDDTTPPSPVKCNCKKSKCLKLYCQCFAKGSFCQNCNCDCCQNTVDFMQVRARAIDQTIMKASLAFGYNSPGIRSCNCKKTGCQKKYCECRSQGVSCSEYCKCSNCQNCKP